MERLVVRLLGEPALTFDGVPLKWTAPPKCLPLLALLALRRDDPMLRPLLATTLWPDDMETDARANLRRHLHRLGRSLPAIDGVEWIVQSGTTIGWNAAAPAWIDVAAFDAAIAAGRLADAVAIYRGDLLEGSYDDGILAERERLRGSYLDALAHLTAAARADRAFSAAVDYAERLLAVDEWREDAVREWMSSKYESGDRSAALAAYERFARRLRDEFAAEPMAETTALRDVIKADLPLPGSPELFLETSVTDSAKRGWRFPFVGRAEPFDRLRALWQRAARGSGGVAFISGEAGIGKSRLAAELVALVRAQGGSALVGTTSFPEGEPYQALVGALRAALAHVGRAAGEGAALAVLGSILPEARVLAADEPVDEDLPINRARERLFDAAARIFEHVARVRPLCVVLEDLHWAGPATVDMLAALARRIGTVPLVIVATYRSEEASPGAAVRALRANLVQERRAIAIPLERLSQESIGELVAAGVASPRSGLIDAVARLSEGNPLFVVQLVENYHETGDVPVESAALHSIGDAIAARFDRLDAGVRAVAQTAAAIGESFRADIVADAGGWSENVVLDGLGSLMDRGLVRESSGSLEYVFSHALFRAAFYEETPEDIKIARHRRVANLLERSRSHDVASLAAIGRHWEGAGEKERAALAYVSAARGALDVYAREEAVSFAEAAYELAAERRTRHDAMVAALHGQDSSTALERRAKHLARLDEAGAKLDDDARFVSLKLRERFVQQIFDADGARRVFDELDDLAARTGRPEHRSYALYARGFGEMQRNALAPARELLGRALADAISAGDPIDIARVRTEYASVLMRMGEWTAARRALAEQLQMMDEHHFRPEQRLGTVSLENSIASVLEDFEALDRTGRQMIDVGRRVGNEFIEAKGHLALGQSSSLEFDACGMREHFTLARDMFEKLAEKAGYRAADMGRAEMELRIGAVQNAAELLERARPSIPAGDRDLQFDVAGRRARLLLLQDDAAGAAAELDRALAFSREVGEPRLVADLRMQLAAARARSGDLKGAVASASEAMAFAQRIEAPAIQLEAACWLVEACVSAGRPDDAAEAAELLAAAWEAGRRDLIYPTFACRVLARLAEAAGDEPRRKRWEERGSRQLAEIAGRLGDPADAAAFGAMFFNRDFTAGRAAG